MDFKIELGESCYRIIGPGGEEGEAVDYGEYAEIRVAGSRYFAVVVDPDAAQPEEMTVYMVGAAQTTRTEEVEFDFEEGGDGEGSGDSDCNDEPDEPEDEEENEEDEELEIDDTDGEDPEDEE